MTKPPQPHQPEGSLNDVQVAFGERVRAARIKAGLLQVDLAEKADMKQGVISDIERGLSNMALIGFRGGEAGTEKLG